MQNFNVSPYYDDFDPTKNYHRILFKPGYAVQARELTQSQTILQNQISNFADNIFTQNTPVTGGKVTTNLNCYYIRLNVNYNNAPITASSFLNKVIMDPTGTVLAKVIATTEATGTTLNPGDPPTLIVSYLSGIHFTDNLLITPTDGTNLFATTVGVTGGSTCTGLSSTASISNGVFYVVRGYSQSTTVNADGTYSKYSIGNFVQVNPQTIILSKYSNTPSYRVGLQITESIVDYVEDASLLDPAVGATNYQAPGADRYLITLTLTTLPTTLGNDDGFIELLRIDGGQVVKQVDGTVYSVIDDYFAKRDYETNGDYIVNDFKLTPSANTLNSAQYDLSIGKGIAYVHGYRIENQSDLKLTSDRARSTNQINNNALYIDYGNYFVVDTSNGVFDVTMSPAVDLHSVTPDHINSANVHTYSSTLVGSAYIRNLSYVTGTGSNTQSYIYNAYLADITTNTLSGVAGSGTTNTLTISDPTGSFSGTANAYYNCTLAITSGTSAGDIRNIVSYSSRTFTVDKPFTLTPDSTTSFSILWATTDVESIVEKNGSYNVTSALNINAAEGKVNGLATGDTIFNSPGTPEMLFPLGSPYVANVSNTDYVSTKVFRGKTFTSTGLSVTITSGPLRFISDGHTPLSTSTALNNYIVVDTASGNILDFSTSGNTVTVTSGQTLTFNSTSYTGKTVDVIARVNVTNGDAAGTNNAGTILKAKNLVYGNTAIVSTSGPSNLDSSGNAAPGVPLGGTTYVDLTNGQTYIANAGTGTGKISLYVTDVKKIVKIIDTGAALTSPTLAMLSSSSNDVTSQYVLHNGQKDNIYDHAYIQLIAGANAAKGNLLVIYDRWNHTGGDGYFSVLSYLPASAGGVSTSSTAYQNIPTYVAKDGYPYRLADTLDFRPVRTSCTTAFSFKYTGTPPSDDTGILIPVNGTTFVSNYSYYQGRKDLLILSKDKSFQIVEGSPADNPIAPSQPDGSLLLANLSHDPYTAYIPGENPGGVSNLSINKVSHNRWAKSDITDLQTRVNNLEYYTSLSVLEQNAQSLQVPDVNGLNRFKNGILVDDFSSFATADTTNADFSANINIRKQQLSPITVVDNFQLQNPIVVNSLHTIKNTNTWAVASINAGTTNLFTLPYTTANVVVQPLASSDVSLNPFSVSIIQGAAQLTPPMDNWVDNSQSPAVLITDPTMQVYQQTNGVNVTNAGDFAIIPGTESTVSSSVSVINHGAFNGPYGSQVGYTATTTSTYASVLQNITTAGNYAPINSTIALNNGYLTNISILPYIRPQQIIVKAKGLLVNTPVETFFDGVNVGQYMTSPNTIELTGVTGTFYENDVVGFYASSKFYPTARVVSVYNYPGTTKTRLYLSQLIGAPSYTTTTYIQNAVYDSNGNYVSYTAKGQVNSGVTSLHNSGVVTGVGGTYTPIGGGSASLIYNIQDPHDWCTFMNQYAVWGDLKQSSSFSSTFNVNIPYAGTYTFIAAASGSTTITANSSTVMSVSSASSATSTTYSLGAGNLTLAWSSSNSSGGPSGIALVINDPYGNQVFASTNPPNVNYDAVAQEVVMAEGGAWFTGVTKIKLDQNANAPANTYFIGAQVTVTSKYVYDYTTQTATYVPPPPAPSGGGGCFIANTTVQLKDSTKNISDVQVGDLVLSADGKSYNTVLYIEVMEDTLFDSLYSPTDRIEPFATVNHPLYIDGVLSSVDPVKNYEIYPWLGKTQKLLPANVVDAKGLTVYNLWVDGDGTYQVNGYGTTSIIGNGGLLYNVYSDGLITNDNVKKLLLTFINEGTAINYGVHLCNKYFGKLNCKFINKVSASVLTGEESSIGKKAYNALFYVVGKIACLVQK